MEKKAISSSQSSLFDSEPFQEAFQEALQDEQEPKQGGLENLPKVYNKKPLTHKTAQKTRSRRVANVRKLLEQAASEEGGGISVTTLLSYLLHLENYHGGDRCVAATGWRIFCGETIS